MASVDRFAQGARFAAVVLGLSGVALPIQVLGQTTVSTQAMVNNATQTPVEGVGHDYIHDLSETVNPQNGQVSIRIAGPATHERGALNYPLYAFMYDTSGRYALGGQLSFSSCTTVGSSVPTCSEQVHAPQYVWSYLPAAGTVVGADRIFANPQTTVSVNYGVSNGGNKTCTYTGPYAYEDPGGGMHTLNWAGNLSGTDCGTFGIGAYTHAQDPHYKAAVYPGYPIVDLHGNVFNGDGMKTAEDTNGNHRNGTGRPWSITTVTEDNASVPSTVTLPGIADPSTSNPLSYTYQYAQYSRVSAPVSAAVITGASTPNCYVDFPLYQGTTFHDTQKLILPNGQFYAFGYESTFGLVNSITYPTGATVSYTWGLNQLSEPFSVISPGYDAVIASTISGQGQQHCYFKQDIPVVKRRVVSYDGVHPAVQQDFSYNTTWGTSGYWNTKQTTVTTTDLIRPGTPKTITVYNYVPINVPTLPWTPGTGLSAVEDTVLYEDGSGTVLRTVKKVWTDVNLLGAECEILDDGSVSGKFYKYLNIANYGTSDLPTDVAEYDYGTGLTSACTRPSGTPTRETTTQYTSIPSSALWNTSTLSSGAIAQTNDRASVVQVYDHGTLISETDICYDGAYGSNCNYQPGIASVTSALAHDETNYGPTQVSTRGNATMITRKCFQNCSDAITKVGYDETGQIVSVIDPRGNTTTLSYTDDYPEGGTPPGNTNTYVTTITRPPTNGVVHQSTFRYNYMLGELVQAKDEDGKLSGYEYVDVWGRPTLATAPDGGQTTIQYNDNGPNPTVSKSVLVNGGGQTITSETIEDGVGHAITALATSDPDGPTEVDTVYDGMGLVYTVSNPYRSKSESTYALTTKTYDALGRPSQTTNPDGTSQTYSYSGPSVTFTNENGNKWTRTSDSFGRLLSVKEPNGISSTASMLTSYSYDALGDLLTVNQAGTGSDGSPRNRSFAYDSLARLIGALNPENTNGQGALRTCTGAATGSKWSTCYGYDPNGNVVSRTDNRGVTATYAYDALNRLLSKSYSDSSTPTACFQYDTSTNGIGRLALEWTQRYSSGSCPSSPTSYLTKRSLSSYDNVGRLWSEQQCTPAGCNTATPCSTANGNQSYSYDYTGNLTCYSNGIASTPGVGSSPLTITQQFSNAGRLTSVSSNWSAFPTGLFAIAQTSGYSPAGGLQNWKFGPNLSVTELYTNRFWVNSIFATGQIP